MRLRLIIFSLLGLFGLIPAVHAAEMEWTIAFYLCGSDLETRGGAATADLQELMSVSLPDNVQVLIMTGGSAEWQNEAVSSGHNEIFLYSSRGIEQLEHLPAANMGDPATLSGFLKYAADNYPAKKTGLIIWDHGGGSVNGVAVDENFDRDRLTLAELKGAIEEVHTPDFNAPPLEFIGFDACLMATIDTAYVCAGVARYMIASQELEPACGWEYNYWASALAQNPSMDGAELGRHICDGFLKGCEEIDQAEDVTLSVTDLDHFMDLWMCYNALGIEAVQSIQESERFYTDYAREANRTQNYANNDDGCSGMVDLGGLTRGLAKDLPNFSGPTLEALQSAIIYKVQGPYTKSEGLSCYYPYDNDPDAVNILYNGKFTTPFLILNGLTSGAIDTATADREFKAILEDVQDYANLQAALEESGSSEEAEEEAVAESPTAAADAGEAEEEEEEEGAGAIAASGENENEPEETTTAAQPAPSAPASASAFSNILASSFQVLSQLNMKPPAVFDIQKLNDHDIDITDDGEISLQLDPEDMEQISDIGFELYYYDEADDILIDLGSDADIEGDWDTGRFVENFHGTWPAFGEHYVHLELLLSGEEFNRYQIPIKLEGKRYLMQVIYDYQSEQYLVTGARQSLDNGSTPDKILRKLTAEDEITTLLPAATLTGDDELQEVELDTFKLGPDFRLADLETGDGTFLFRYRMTDLTGKHAFSKFGKFEVKDGEITTELAVNPGPVQILTTAGTAVADGAI